ncbi:maltose/maltodextrin ABC transporter, substrate binding periplasmic protein MalE (plasmid) [Lacticaseibacillus paracasei]|nr:maltose/maltodextrin ABC transporter, substrate binding periplasmic protein MalE [Lacticaseibacillus paracasei]
MTINSKKVQLQAFQGIEAFAVNSRTATKEPEGSRYAG